MAGENDTPKTGPTERARIRREARRAAELCYTCGKHPWADGKNQCAVCIGKMVAAYEKNKDRPKRCRCGAGPLPPRKMFCEECGKTRRCVACLKPNPGKSSRCPECAEKRRGGRNVRIAAGLCPECTGDVRPEPGFLVCVQCREQRNEGGRKSRDRKRAIGVCLSCKNPVLPGHLKCPRHLEADRNRKDDAPKLQRYCRHCLIEPVPATIKVCDACKVIKKRKDGKKKVAMAAANGQCLCCRQVNDRVGMAFCTACKNRKRLKSESVKRQCMDGYGGKCRCCGETRLEFLTLDHVNNDGNIRRASGAYPGAGAGPAIYKYAIRLGFPSELQAYCWNCNFGKRITGTVCPHELERDGQTDGCGI